MKWENDTVRKEERGAPRHPLYLWERTIKGPLASDVGRRRARSPIRLVLLDLI